MTKQEVQARVLKNGKPLDLDLFRWDEKTRTFSSYESGLVLDFKNIDNCTFNTDSDCTFDTGADCTFVTGADCIFNTGSRCTFDTGADCTFDTGYGCIFNTGYDCIFNTGSRCTFDTGADCTFDTGYGCTFDTGNGCTFNTGYGCTFDTGSGCTFDTGSGCIFNTGYDCIFNTGSRCTFNTDSDCTFNTDSDCTFDTGYDCIFNTGNGCTFNTGYDCIFNTGYDCIFNTGYDCTLNIFHFGYIVNTEKNNVAIIRYDDKKAIYDLDTLSKNTFIKLELSRFVEKPIKNFELIDDSIMIKLSTEKEVDNITVFKAQYIEDYFEDNNEYVFIAKSGKHNAHGSDIKDAIKNVIFKQQYELGAEENAKRVVKSGVVTMEDYRLLTGSCEVGTKRFMDEQGIPYDTTLTIQEALELVTKTRAYRSEVFKENLEKAGYTFKG